MAIYLLKSALWPIAMVRNSISKIQKKSEKVPCEMKLIKFWHCAALRRSQITQPVRTLFLFKSIWTQPQGSQGCQKIRIFFYKKNCWVLALRWPQKGTNFEKSSKLKKTVKKTCFLRVFWKHILQFWVNLSAPNLKWLV